MIYLVLLDVVNATELELHVKPELRLNETPLLIDVGIAEVVELAVVEVVDVEVVELVVGIPCIK